MSGCPRGGWPSTVRSLTPATPGRAHFADAVGKVHRALWGAAPMPHQRHFHRLSTELLEDGSWAWQTIIKTIPRQGGKTSGASAVELHRCLIRPLARCWFTAQTRQDARDTVVEEWGRRWERTPFASLGKLRESQGSEGIYFRGTTGASLRVFPPEEGGLDGKANERVTVDEPWRIKPHVGAALDNSILPTFLTTGGQLTMISTAGTARSTWLRSKVDQGRDALAAGATTGTAILEYGCPDDVAGEVRALLEHGVYGGSFDRAVQLLAEHNPAYGYTLRLDALANGVRALMADPEEGGPDGVLRAYGNVWSKTAQVLVPLPVFDAAALADPPEPPPAAALGVAQGIDRADVAVVAAWRDHTGRPYARVLDHTGDVTTGPALLAARRRSRAWAAAACAGAGPVLELVDTAERRHRLPRLTRLTSRDYATACAQTLTLLLAQLLAHDGHPALRDAVEGAAKRRVDDGGWAWARADSEGSVAALEAATVALWAHDHRAEWEDPAMR